jgi:hypothetical protein
MMKALAEVALAADSPLVRATTDDDIVNASVVFFATNEATRLVAKNFAFFDDHLTTKSWSDGALYFAWNHQYVGKPRIQDTAHGGFELGSVAVLYEDMSRLNAILAKVGRSERLTVSAERLGRFATTFLRLVWKYAPNDMSRQNIIAENVDGSGNASYDANANVECGGWIPLAQVDPWVWVRARDSVFKYPGCLRVDNHAALLRYRARSADPSPPLGPWLRNAASFTALSEASAP